MPGISTWSWASIATCPLSSSNDGDGLGGVPVRWAATTGSLDRGTPLLHIGRITTIPVDKTTLATDWSRTIVPADDFAHDNRFKVLTVTVTVQSAFATPEDAVVAAKLTGHDAEAGCAHWRRITLPDRPDVIAGWASLEHPDFAAAQEEGATVSALFLERRKVEGSLGWGRLRGGHWVFRVLFVRARAVNKWESFYERVGVGRLFGPESCEFLEETEETTVHLG